MCSPASGRTPGRGARVTARTLAPVERDDSRARSRARGAAPRARRAARLGRRTACAHQRDRLRALLAHAIERSPFHARRLPASTRSASSSPTWPQLPVMTKPRDDGRLRRGGHRPAARPAHGRGRTSRPRTASPVPALRRLRLPGLGRQLRACAASSCSARASTRTSAPRSCVAPGPAWSGMGGPPPGVRSVAMVAADLADPRDRPRRRHASRTGPFRFVAAPATALDRDRVEILERRRPRC